MDSYENVHWDVIVIGAGMAGLLTACYLQKEGKAVLVLEAKEVASGQTGRTTAKITSQHGLKYSKMIKDVGWMKTKLYAMANQQAIEEYEKLVQELDIDCGFKRAPAYLYTLKDPSLVREEAKVASALGIDAAFTEETELPFPVKGAVVFRNQAMFTPMKFVERIASELNIREYTKVIKVRGNKVVTHDETLTADHIVVATHYPIINVPGFYFLRQHQERSYVLALAGCKEIEGMYIGIDENGFSFRQEGKYLLFGGSSQRTGKNKIGNAYNALSKMADIYFPDGKEEIRWSAQDCMPHDGIPFIGRYSVFTPNLYVATGFQKWGMTTSMVAAQILRDEICGKENPYKKLFSPQRLNLRAGFRNFVTDVGESIMGLTKGIFHRKGPRCAHMGCELVWNPDEETWDCPCHGSRFGRGGELKDNPAKRRLDL